MCLISEPSVLTLFHITFVFYFIIFPSLQIIWQIQESCKIHGLHINTRAIYFKKKKKATDILRVYSVTFLNNWVKIKCSGDSGNQGMFGYFHGSIYWSTTQACVPFYCQCYLKKAWMQLQIASLTALLESNSHMVRTQWCISASFSSKCTDKDSK